MQSFCMHLFFLCCHYRETALWKSRQETGKPHGCSLKSLWQQVRMLSMGWTRQQVTVCSAGLILRWHLLHVVQNLFVLLLIKCNANVRSTDPVPESQNASIFLSCTLFLDCFLHAVEFCRIMKQSTLTQRHQMVCPASKWIRLLTP